MTEAVKFGTSGLRGLASILEAEAGRYVSAFIRHLRAGGQLGHAEGVLIGRDLRASSPAVTSQVAAAIRAEGLQPVDCGVLPTPALALEALRVRVPAIMVTGSHIPADRNGLKFYAPAGEITKADEAGILAQLAEAGAVDGRVQLPESDEALEHYRQRCTGLLRPGALKGMRVGVYQHSSLARDLLPEVLEHYGADVVRFGWSDAFVAVDTEAVDAEVAQMLAQTVESEKLDAIVSTDGDADRPLVVADNGQLVRGDELGILTAQFLRADVVVTPVTSTSAIEASELFPSVLRTRVGSPYVLAGIADAARQGARLPVGFEPNGGFLLGAPADDGRLAPLPTRDALLPILAVLGTAAEAGQPVTRVLSALPQRATASGRLQDVAPERSADVLRRLGSSTFASSFFAEQGAVLSLSSLDGLRFTLETGDIVHYRASGNAPELRCYAEAATALRAQALVDWGLRQAEALIRT